MDNNQTLITIIAPTRSKIFFLFKFVVVQVNIARPFDINAVLAPIVYCRVFNFDWNIAMKNDNVIGVGIIEDTICYL